MIDKVQRKEELYQQYRRIFAAGFGEGSAAEVHARLHARQALATNRQCACCLWVDQCADYDRPRLAWRVWNRWLDKPGCLS